MSKSNRIRNNRSEEDLRAKMVLNSMAAQSYAPTVPALDMKFMAQLNAIKEAQSVPRKAMQREIADQLKTAHIKFLANEIAVILWVMYQVYGFNYYKLLEFCSLYNGTAKALTDFYEFDYEDENSIFAFAQKLREETGVDVNIIVDQVNEVFCENSPYNPHSKKFAKRWSRP